MLAFQAHLQWQNGSKEKKRIGRQHEALQSAFEHWPFPTMHCQQLHLPTTNQTMAWNARSNRRNNFTPIKFFCTAEFVDGKMWATPECVLLAKCLSSSQWTDRQLAAPVHGLEWSRHDECRNAHIASEQAAMAWTEQATRCMQLASDDLLPVALSASVKGGQFIAKAV